MEKIFFILPILIFGCSGYITRHDLNNALHETARQTSEEINTRSESVSLAAYECIITEDYVYDAYSYCENNDNTSPMCELPLIWNSFCFIMVMTDSDTRELINPRPGVRHALKHAIDRIRSSNNADGVPNPMGNTDSQIEDERFIRTAE